MNKDNIKEVQELAFKIGEVIHEQDSHTVKLALIAIWDLIETLENE